MPNPPVECEALPNFEGDPLLRAAFGPLRLLALDAREYSVGRTPDNEFQLVGKFSHYTSAWLILCCIHASHSVQVESTANLLGVEMK